MSHVGHLVKKFFISSQNKFLKTKCFATKSTPKTTKGAGLICRALGLLAGCLIASDWCGHTWWVTWWARYNLCLYPFREINKIKQTTNRRLICCCNWMLSLVLFSRSSSNCRSISSTWYLSLYCANSASGIQHNLADNIQIKWAPLLLLPLLRWISGHFPFELGSTNPQVHLPHLF